jgi:uncharacterized integral membrane protein
VDEKEQAAGEPPPAAPGNEQQVGEAHQPETVGGVRHTRMSAVWTATAVAVLLGVVLIASIVQNTQKVQIKFFGASGHIPLVVDLLAAALIGGTDCPRGGDFSHYSAPTIRSAALQGNEAHWERSYGSVVTPCPFSFG